MLIGLASLARAQDEAQRPPNFVVIFCDDLGYGDLGCYGHPTIRTPELDRMAREGQRWTDFYVSASVCTPSRAGLITGRLPIRNGMCSSKRHVLFPNSGGGLPVSEVTIAEMLKTRGYATACVGKWHLGHLPQFLPTKHGFDEYFGIPYSNDMTVKRRGDPPLPLMKNDKVIESGVDQRTLTKRYTEYALDFIRRSKDKPFFLYYPQTFPHIPLFASEDFKGKSPRGLYGDVVEEIDWSVGQILAELRKTGLDENTLVIFTSDNGPWLSFGVRGGSAGLLRGGKTTTWDGGMRVPAICWWPGRIKPATVARGLGSTLDLLPTFAALAGAELDPKRILDGVDLRPALFGTGPSPRTEVFFYRGTRLCALRQGAHKLHLWVRRGRRLTKVDPPQLFRLDRDPSEQREIAKSHPKIVAKLLARAKQFEASFKPPPSQLEIPLPKK